MKGAACGDKPRELVPICFTELKTQYVKQSQAKSLQPNLFTEKLKCFDDEQNHHYASKKYVTEKIPQVLKPE